MKGLWFCDIVLAAVLVKAATAISQLLVALTDIQSSPSSHPCLFQTQQQLLPPYKQEACKSNRYFQVLRQHLLPKWFGQFAGGYISHVRLVEDCSVSSEQKRFYNWIVCD